MLKILIKNIYGALRKRLVKKHLNKFDEFNLVFKNNNTISLNVAVPGVYRVALLDNTDKKLYLRFLELGFLPNTKLRVLKNTGKNGSTLIKIRGSKIALSNKIANKILLERK